MNVLIMNISVAMNVAYDTSIILATSACNTYILHMQLCIYMPCSYCNCLNFLGGAVKVYV